MKVRQLETKQFKPFELTIETEDEAKLLWSAFNVSAAAVFKAAESHDISYVTDNPENKMYEMWDKIDSVYDPHKKELAQTRRSNYRK